MTQRDELSSEEKADDSGLASLWAFANGLSGETASIAKRAYVAGCMMKEASERLRSQVEIQEFKKAINEMGITIAKFASQESELESLRGELGQQKDDYRSLQTERNHYYDHFETQREMYFKLETELRGELKEKEEAIEYFKDLCHKCSLINQSRDKSIIELRGRVKLLEEGLKASVVFLKAFDNNLLESISYHGASAKPNPIIAKLESLLTDSPY
jgi:chromosome segregation ATPase